MIENSDNLTVNTKSRPLKYKSVSVEYASDQVKQVAEVATTVIMQKFGEALGLTREQVLEVNEVGLQAALMKAISGEAVVPKDVMVPSYFDSMIRGLTVVIGRTVVSADNPSTKVVCPEHYKQSVMILKAAGVKFVRPHQPVEEKSATLALDTETIDGVVTVIGNLKDVEIEDMVRRGLLEVEEQSLQDIRALAGELALNYGELDSLTSDYFIAQTRTALG